MSKVNPPLRLAGLIPGDDGPVLLLVSPLGHPQRVPVRREQLLSLIRDAANALAIIEDAERGRASSD